METKKSKVLNTFLKREGDGKYGHYYIHGITFENGDAGDYMAKSNPQKYFIVGQEADYTKETTQNGNYTNVVIKPVQAAQGGKGFFGGSPTAQNKRTALECAVSLAVAGKIQLDQIGATAQKYVAWLNVEASAPQPTAKPEPAPAPAKSAEPFLPPAPDDDSLPF